MSTMTAQYEESEVSMLQAVTGSQLATRGSTAIQRECKAGFCRGITS
jgi:hypothetical protein